MLSLYCNQWIRVTLPPLSTLLLRLLGCFAKEHVFPRFFNVLTLLLFYLFNSKPKVGGILHCKVT